MKSVLASFKPKYCELIASGRKTVEIRKSRPKLEVPFKVYMYQTKGHWIYKILEWLKLYQGKVIGEFVCDYIVDWDMSGSPSRIPNSFVIDGCLSPTEICEYGYKGRKGLHGWHISDLVIYDKPRELGEFFYACNKPQGTDCSKCMDAREQSCKALTRPPQSWCYVEEVQG